MRWGGELKEHEHISSRKSHTESLHLTSPAAMHYSVFAQPRPNQNGHSESVSCKKKTKRWTDCKVLVCSHHAKPSRSACVRVGYCGS